MCSGDRLFGPSFLFPWIKSTWPGQACRARPPLRMNFCLFVAGVARRARGEFRSKVGWGGMWIYKGGAGTSSRIPSKWGCFHAAVGSLHSQAWSLSPSRSSDFILKQVACHTIASTHAWVGRWIRAIFLSHIFYWNVLSATGNDVHVVWLVWPGELTFIN